ncbi:multiple monosaccharide ABC transporter permease [Fundicoccus sp. Sow4_D5]|uniref:multiple monosaccharide ABC transporter permease n=1 Tax=unclassified Fundicoccus TaxID=2761543 RepID=UPI003F9365F9
MSEKNTNKASEMLRKIFEKYSMIIILIVTLLIFQYLTNGILLRPVNVTNLVLQNSHILVLAIGMLMVVLLGHVDLSVGSVMAFVGAISAILMIQQELSPWLVVPICLLIGGLIGAWQGFWIAYVKIPAFIVTLAGLLLFRGLTQYTLKGTSIANYPEMFNFLSSGYLPSMGEGELHMTSLLIGGAVAILLVAIMVTSRNKKKANLLKVETTTSFFGKLAVLVVTILGVTYIFSQHNGFPFVMILIAILAGGYTFVTNRTVMGRHIYATGGNYKSAELSGVKTKKVTFWVFVNMGVLAALAGMILAARLNAATPQAGNGIELDALSAVYFGGASTSGGIGTIVGALVGGLIIGVLNNGMSILGVGIDLQQAIRGLILLLAVVIDQYNKRKKG